MKQETLSTGQQVLMPCASGEPGAFKCTGDDLSEEQECRLMMRKVRMVDIELVVRDTVDVTSRATVQRFNDFNKKMGMRVG